LSDITSSGTGHLEVVKHEPFNAESPARALIDAITPASAIFVRSNFAVPALGGEEHRVVVGGAVLRDFTFSAGELRSMRESYSSVTMTMECAGNGRLSMRPLPTGELWDAGAVSTSRWTGIPLRVILERAGVDTSAVEILVGGADTAANDDRSAGFARALPISEAMRDEVLLAFDLNDEPLSASHGAPLRLLVPGWYGMASVKWVSRISALARPFEGYFQRERYIYDEPGRVPVPVTRVRVKSIITSPVDGATRGPGVIDIAGWAWSGSGPIRRVEVALDGGCGWRDATLHAPESDFAWTPWSLTMESVLPGRHTLRSRATDATGNTQPDMIPWNRHGYGNNAVRLTVFTVE